MRCPKCGTEAPPDALECPSCKLLTPQGRTSRNLTLNVEARKEKLGKLKRYGAVAAAVIIVMVVGGYAYVILDSASRVDPKIALDALQTLRRLPSSQEGVNIDDYMSRLLKESQEGGRLQRYRGWHVKPVDGTKKKVILVFSFEEATGEQRAEWLADTTSGTFTPHTPLARKVSGT